MFKNNFINLCNQKKEAPSAVCMKLGLSNATFSKWTDESVPRRATLQRIADYFNVSVDYLLGKEEKKSPSKILAPSFSLTPHETSVVIAYRKQPEMQPAIDKLLGVSAEEEETVTLYTAAYSKENSPDEIITISKAEWEKLKKLPTTDQDLK